MLVSNRLS